MADTISQQIASNSSTLRYMHLTKRIISVYSY